MAAVDEDTTGMDAADQPWPPPGLEHLEGALAVPIRRATLGSLLLALPVLWALSSTASFAIGGAGLAFLLIATGLVFFLGAILRTAGVIDQARRAMLLGYPRSLVAEIVSDLDRRAGALRLEREPFATVPTEARRQARSLRVRAVMLALIAALMTPPMLAIAVMLAVRGTVPLIGVVAVALAPGLLLALAAAAMRLWSLTLLQWSRSAGAWDPSPVSLQDRVDAWRARFIPDQHMQRPGLLPLALASIAGIVTFVFVLIMVTMPVLLALRGGSVGIDYAATQANVPSTRRIEIIRPWRLPVDSSIDALRAGAALYELAHVGRPRSYEGDSTPAYLEQPWLPVEDAARRPENVIFAAAFGTGSPELREALQRVRSHPADSLVALVARAPAADVVGARYGAAAPSSLEYSDFSFARRTLSELARARTARAGFLAAEGRTAEAELLLREVASLAVLLHDEALTPIDALFAGQIARSIAEGLAALYEHTGRSAEAASLRRTLHATETAARRGRSSNPHSALRRTMADSTAPAWARWDALNTYVILQRCRHPRAAVFGDSPAGSLQELRAQLVRRPSDALIFDQITQFPLDDLDRGVPRMVRRALTAVMGSPSDANFCLWGGTFF